MCFFVIVGRNNIKLKTKKKKAPHNGHNAVFENKYMESFGVGCQPQHARIGVVFFSLSRRVMQVDWVVLKRAGTRKGPCETATATVANLCSSVV